MTFSIIKNKTCTIWDGEDGLFHILPTGFDDGRYLVVDGGPANNGHVTVMDNEMLFDKFGLDIENHTNGTFVFTPENLIKNLDKLGGWSSFGLAEEAIEHYHPEVLEKEGIAKLDYMALLKCDGNENTYWQDWIEKYHAEVGYKGPFDVKSVNEY